MIRDIRGIALVAVLTVAAAVLIAIPRVEISAFNYDIARGDEETFLGLSLGLDLEGGSHLVYDIVTEDGSPPTEDDVEAIRSIIERRVNEFGVSEPTVQLLGSPPSRVLIQIPGQSASSLTITFGPDGPDLDEIRDFFETDLGKSGVDITENEDESLTVRFDDFDGAEADAWRETAEQKFATRITASFEFDPVDDEEEDASLADSDEFAPSAPTDGDDAETPEADGEDAGDGTPASEDDAMDGAEDTMSSDDELTAESDATPDASPSADGTAMADDDGAMEDPDAMEDADATPSADDDGAMEDDAMDGGDADTTPEADDAMMEDDAMDGGDTDTDTDTDAEDGDATGDEEEETRVAPSQDAVQEAYNAAGFDTVEIEECEESSLFQQGAPGQFFVVNVSNCGGDFNGRLMERTTDEDGEVLPSDIERLRRELVQIGDLAQLNIEGNIQQWTVAGGIQEAKALIGSTAKLEFRERSCGPLAQPADWAGETWPPDGLSESEWLLLRCSDPLYFNEQATNISASDLVDAFPSVEGTPPEPVVTIVFNDNGRDAFFEVTGRVSRNRDVLAIYLDDAELVAPTVDTGGEGIAGGRAVIRGGDFTNERVRTMAIQLRSGALPAELVLTEERNVDAILGADSLRRSLIAGAVGLVLLIIFMIAYYKLPGIVASIALLAYAILLLGAFKLVPVTLTLSGAAAVILSLGFAVDANILIAERTKEELRAGRGLLAAINSGFDRAWPSIRDGNLSTIIVALVLYWFGDRFSTSIMQGFALTLGIGVLLSMFTAFFASRLILRLVARTPFSNRLNWFVPVPTAPRATARAVAAPAASEVATTAE